MNVSIRHTNERITTIRTHPCLKFHSSFWWVLPPTSKGKIPCRAMAATTVCTSTDTLDGGKYTSGGCCRKQYTKVFVLGLSKLQEYERN